MKNNFLVCFLTIFFVVSCSKNKMENRKVKLAYVEWDCATASINVVKAVLQEKLKYKVEIIPVTAAVMWQSLATSNVDGFTTAWLPTTHEHYLKKVKDRVVDLGPNLKGTKIGLVVPEYVTINSIEELNQNVEKFNGKIIGIDPGAGLMSKTELVVKEYNLRNFKLIEGSGATMVAALSNAVKNKEWIVVTGWTPHWKFGRWKLKYLEDTKKIFGGAEYIHTFVRKGLKKEMPEVYKFLDNFSWTPSELESLMAENQKKNGDPYKNAKKWIAANEFKVNSWLK